MFACRSQSLSSSSTTHGVASTSPQLTRYAHVPECFTQSHHLIRLSIDLRCGCGSKQLLHCSLGYGQRLLVPVPAPSLGWRHCCEQDHYRTLLLFFVLFCIACSHFPACSTRTCSRIPTHRLVSQTLVPPTVTKLPSSGTAYVIFRHRIDTHMLDLLGHPIQRVRGAVGRVDVERLGCLRDLR